MSGFKLLAIRPLEGCDKRFLRILKPGEIYSFYNSCNFILKNPKDTHSEVIDVIIPIEPNLYDIKGLPINISAVVGKNGSGKSSLIELFFAAIFVASSHDGILKTNINNLQKDYIELDNRRSKNKEKRRKLEIQRSDLEKKVAILKDLELVNKFAFIESEFKKIRDAEEEIENEENSIAQDELEIEFMLNEINRLELDVKVEVYYKVKNSIYRLKIDYPKKDSTKKVDLVVQHKLIVGNTREKGLWDLLNDENKIDFSQFFYSIAISYSHYGLNSKVIGDWVTPLFHKNDGYQTPLVINPMRTEGNININTENDLVKQRLLLNLLEDIGSLPPNESLRNLAPDKTAFALELKYDEEKIFSYHERKIRTKKVYPSDKFLNELCLKYVGSNKIGDHGDQIVEGLKIYIGHKLIRICENYDRYKRFIVKGKFNNDPKLIDQLISDKSHITFKLKQALNFLILGHLPISDRNKTFNKDLDTFSDYIKNGEDYAKTLKKTPSRIELLPPSIFKQTIKLSDGSDLDDLSSGEKQIIHSISSIVYHIINVNSVANNGADKFKLGIESTQSYRNINILFDEVEQYFHPELQRQFIAKLLDYLSKMNKTHFNNIDGINILLATHSPFILSDIPNSNILRLKDGMPTPEESQTFGANIHNLLANDFFLEKGFMGEFAKGKINEVITFINNKKQLDELTLLIPNLEKELLKLEDKKSEKSKRLSQKIKAYKIELEDLSAIKFRRINEEHYSTIKLIGEPALKDKILEMFHSAFPEIGKDESYEQELALLKRKYNKE